MKIFSPVVLVLVLVLPLLAQNTGLPTGSQWRETDRSFRIGYVMGISQGITLGVLGERLDDPVILRIATCSVGVTVGQKVAIVDKFLEDHPEEWHKSIASIYLRAVAVAYPASSCP